MFPVGWEGRGLAGADGHRFSLLCVFARRVTGWGHHCGVGHTDVLDNGRPLETGRFDTTEVVTSFTGVPPSVRPWTIVGRRGPIVRGVTFKDY